MGAPIALSWRPVFAQPHPQFIHRTATGTACEWWMSWFLALCLFGEAVFRMPPPSFRPGPRRFALGVVFVVVLCVVLLSGTEA